MDPRKMRVSEHAVRRYKQRIGKRSASKKNIINEIHRQVRLAFREKRFKYSEECYPSGHPKFAIVDCGSFRAVVARTKVITVMTKDQKMSKEDVYAEFQTFSSTSKERFTCNQDSTVSTENNSANDSKTNSNSSAS